MAFYCHQIKGTQIKVFSRKRELHSPLVAAAPTAKQKKSPVRRPRVWGGAPPRENKKSTPPPPKSSPNRNKVPGPLKVTRPLGMDPEKWW